MQVIENIYKKKRLKEVSSRTWILNGKQDADTKKTNAIAFVLISYIHTTSSVQ